MNSGQAKGNAGRETRSGGDMAGGAADTRGREVRARRVQFGLHYDMHVRRDDTAPGTAVDIDYLVDIFTRLEVEFVQTDCKGHPGYTSWFSRSVPDSVPPNLQADQLAVWREASRRLGIPLHCHYSGIYEMRAAEVHPDWRVVPGSDEIPVDPNGQNAGAPAEYVLCPRSPYLHERMIPQMKELIDRYGVDGFWIDGDIWAVRPCYCERCTAAFSKQTGLTRAPRDTDDPEWPTWINFVRESFESYVRRYVEAVHAHAPQVRVCSNWMQTLRHPGAPEVPTDWISGDNTWVFGYEDARVEAPFLDGRRREWDIMIWNFYKLHAMFDGTVPWTPKPPEMVMQEAAQIMAHGGSVQVYENGAGLRDGRFVPWRIRELEKVSAFVQERKEACSDTETLPQAVVLHSEHHARRGMGENLMWGVDVNGVRGATFALLENHVGADVMDEWALLPRLHEFPLVLVPEQTHLSQDAVDALGVYARRGGTLLLSGAGLVRRFHAILGEELGLSDWAASSLEGPRYHCSLDERTVVMYSPDWIDLRALTGKAEVISALHTGPIVGENALGAPAAVRFKVGEGTVVLFAGDLFGQYYRTRYPLQRALVGELVRRSGAELLPISAPLGVDVVLRRRGRSIFVHAINRLSGTLTGVNDGAVTEIPPVGPVSLDPTRLHGSGLERPGASRANRGDVQVTSPVGSAVSTDASGWACIEQVRIHEIMELFVE